MIAPRTAKPEIVGMASSGWTILGLILNLGGVIVLWLFAIPRRTRSQEGDYMLTERADPKAVQADRLYDRWTWFGLGLIVLSTVCQIAGSWPTT
jgi:uncharacterized membrane protein